VSGPDGVPPPPRTKPDPQSLVLRGRPKPILRLRKGLTVGLAGTASALLVALAWVSLKAPAIHVAVREGEGLRPASGNPEALAGVPSDYAHVPRLGPPLPGDLGRAILDRQRENAAMRAGGPEPVPEEAASSGARQQERRLSEERAALLSGVLVQQAASAPPAAPAVSAPAPEAAGPATPALPKQAPSPWTLSAGSIIPASLITGINSDIPGPVVAQVTEAVRDSATGRTILIPQGARLIGSCDSAPAFGQKRALLVWHRIVFPDGSSVDLEAVPASDAAGYSGIADKIDFHEGRLLEGIALASLLGIGSELGSAGSNADLARALRQSVQDNGARAGDQIVARNLDVRPTLTVRPGWPVRAVLSRDLELRPWDQR
jgi:type IV secretion system protein VirB10